MTKDYRPISCALHERLEFSVLRKIPLILQYYGEDSTVLQEQVAPLDVKTRGSAEWLTFQRGDGSVAEMRLDAMISIQEAGS
ncbi:MAG TPA: transcriptional antiterminator, Rof [Betaproteobacteria bacterium]|nr:transcriptional antiterminator, Rof [Betaproteobacteria bacterium]